MRPNLLKSKTLLTSIKYNNDYAKLHKLADKWCIAQEPAQLFLITDLTMRSDRESKNDWPADDGSVFVQGTGKVFCYAGAEFAAEIIIVIDDHARVKWTKTSLLLPAKI